MLRRRPSAGGVLPILARDVKPTPPECLRRTGLWSSRSLPPVATSVPRVGSVRRCSPWVWARLWCRCRRWPLLMRPIHRARARLQPVLIRSRIRPRVVVTRNRVRPHVAVSRNRVRPRTGLHRSRRTVRARGDRHRRNRMPRTPGRFRVRRMRWMRRRNLLLRNMIRSTRPRRTQHRTRACPRCRRLTIQRRQRDR
jgi:hypothetical protein